MRRLVIELISDNALNPQFILEESTNEGEVVRYAEIFRSGVVRRATSSEEYPANIPEEVCCIEKLRSGGKARVRELDQSEFDRQWEGLGRRATSQLHSSVGIRHLRIVELNEGGGVREISFEESDGADVLRYITVSNEGIIHSHIDSAIDVAHPHGTISFWEIYLQDSFRPEFIHRETFEELWLVAQTFGKERYIKLV